MKSGISRQPKAGAQGEMPGMGEMLPAIAGVANNPIVAWIMKLMGGSGLPAGGPVQTSGNGHDKMGF